MYQTNQLIQKKKNLLQQLIIQMNPVKNSEKEKPVLISENNESQQSVISDENLEFKVQVGACHRKIPYQGVASALSG